MLLLALAEETLKGVGVTAVVEVEGGVLHQLLPGIVDGELRMHNIGIHTLCLTTSLGEMLRTCSMRYAGNQGLLAYS